MSMTQIEWFAGQSASRFTLQGDEQSPTVVDASQIVVARLVLDIFQLDAYFVQALEPLHPPADRTNPGNVTTITMN
jgi:hypothetical protein